MQASTGNRYQITIGGAIDPNWSDWLGALAVEQVTGPEGSCFSVLTGLISDQSALRGILMKIWDLNLELIAVQRLDAGPTNLPAGS